MNNLGNTNFSSNDPFKSRREFNKKKGGRPRTEWEDHIEEIEPPIREMDRNIAKC